jgi:CRP-like cAMP-binding protein
VKKSGLKRYWIFYRSSRKSKQEKYMPKPMQYKAGSVIYFNGDKDSEKVFILQTGMVQLSYTDIETGQDIHDTVQPGEFFGVKSALGKYAREESALALQDTVLMVFTVQEFETVAMANTRIVMKMLKVFSNQLRRIHKQVSSLMEKDEENQETGLFNIGEYYLKNRRFSQAKYIFHQYLTYYPTGKNAAQAAKNLESVDISLARYAGKDSRSSDAADKTGSANRGSGGANLTGKGEGDSATAKSYYNAVSFVSQEKYQQAFVEFKKIVDANEDAEYTAKSTYELGRCLFMLNHYNDCIKYYTQMIKKYPKHSQLEEALFFMGQSYEKIEQPDKAIPFYKTILAKINDEDNAIFIKTKRALKALEG